MDSPANRALVAVVNRDRSELGLEPLTADGWNPVKQWRAPKGEEGAGRFIEMPDIRAILKSGKELRAKWGIKEKGPPKKPPARSPVKRFTPEGRKSFDQVAEGFRKGTHDELRAYNNSPMWSGIHINKDPNALNPVTLIKADGTKEYHYLIQHHVQQERKKWDRIVALFGHREKIRSDLQKKVESGDDNATALYLSLLTGMRPSSEKAASGGEKTYGSSNLLAQHVPDELNEDGSLTVTFPGKSGKINNIRVTDPTLIEALQHRKRNLGPDDELFPAALPSEMNKMLDQILPPEFSNKDLRTLQANMLATEAFEALVEANGGVGPQTPEEFNEWMTQVIKWASDRLGNTPDAFQSSYLSQAPFMDWIPPGADMEEWWRWGKKMGHPTKPGKS